MASFKITGKSTVKSFREAFKVEYGATLIVYNGSSKAIDSKILFDMGVKTGTVEFSSYRTVGDFIKTMKSKFNLEVEVSIADGWVEKWYADRFPLDRGLKQLEERIACLKDSISQQEATIAELRSKLGDAIKLATSCTHVDQGTDQANIIMDDTQLKPEEDHHEKYGYINNITGGWVIQPQFDDAEEFHDGMAAVTVNEKIGFIDKMGHMIWEPQFDDILSLFPVNRFYGDIAIIYQNDLYGFIKNDGTWVVKPEYRSIEVYRSSGRERIVSKSLSTKGKSGAVIIKDGKLILEVKKGELRNPTKENISNL